MDYLLNLWAYFADAVTTLLISQVLIWRICHYGTVATEGSWETRCSLSIDDVSNRRPILSHTTHCVALSG